MMKKQFKLFFLFATAAAIALHAQDKPQIQKLPVIIDKISDNGLWGVSQKGSEVDGTLAPAGGIIYNLTTLAETDISDVSGLSGVGDVTDDGAIAVGECQGKPAYWSKNKNGWTILPMPDPYLQGRLNAVTPDGKFAVGYVIPPDFNWGAYPVLYDLTKDELIPLEGLPTLDMTNQDQRQNCFYDISADGRYISASLSVSYILPASLCSYIYDVQEKTYRMIGFTENFSGPWKPKWDNLYFVDGPAISHNGLYTTGTAYIVESISGSEFGNEYRSAFLYDYANDDFTVYNKKGENDIVGMAVLNDGTVFGVSPAVNPYANMLIRSGNYFVGLDQVFKQVYGIDFQEQTGYSVTGKPLSVSSDGRTFIMLPTTSETYILRMPEPLKDAAAKVDLLANYTSSPASGSVMGQLRNVRLTFDREIETNCSYNRITCVSEDGTESWNPLPSNGYIADGYNLSITFRSRDLRPGEVYTLTLPAGAVRIKGDRQVTNHEIKIKFTGRNAGAVTMTDCYPAEGASVSAIDASTNPMIVSFDATVRLADNAQAALYRVGEDEPFVSLNIASAANRIQLYPTSAQHLFSGTDYKVVIPAGTVTDISGTGANEEITINYRGAYVREISSDDRYLFASDCSDYDSFIFYEGDHFTPAATPAGWGFTANNPWYIVRSSSEVTDMAMAAHSMYTNEGKADDWMSTPQLFIPDTDCYLTFDAQSYLKSKQDKLKVYVYASGNVYNTFTSDIVDEIRTNGDLVFNEVLSPGESEEGLEDDWTRYTVSLAKYAGKDIYIAFVNENQNQSAIFMDNIHVVHDLKYLTTFVNETRVVNQNDIIIRGNITVASEVAKYSTVKMQLKDGEGTLISEISDEGLELAKDDVYNFEFPQPLSLVKGTVNPYSVEIALDTTTTIILGEVRNLSFQPVKKIVLEEYSGATCSNCPLGILAMENLERLYPENVVPVVLRAYGGDQLGIGIGSYVEFLGLEAAPSARINRGDVVFPMVSNMGDYMLSGAGLKDSETGADILTWLDVFRRELAEPADMDLEIESAYDAATQTVNAVCSVRNALNVKDSNVNIFAVITENGLTSFQDNGFSSVEDPDLGEWGKGGSNGSLVYPYTVNDVARGSFGTTYNGTGGLVPSEMESGKYYNANLRFTLPKNIENADNCFLTVMLIDAGKGTILNANRVALNGATGAVDKIAADGNDAIAIVAVDGKVIARAACDNLNVQVYAVDGRLVASAAGSDTVAVDLGGYRGTVIVKVNTDTANAVRKLAVE